MEPRRPQFRLADVLLYRDRTPFVLADLADEVWGIEVPRKTPPGAALTRQECALVAAPPRRRSP